MEKRKIEELETVIVVDGCSTGTYLAPCLKSLGYGVILVLSRPEDAFPEPFFKSLRPEEFDYVTTFQSVEQIQRELKNFNITDVLSGFDLGTTVADKLALAYCPEKANDLSLTMERQDKYLMCERLSANNLSLIKQIKIKSIKELEPWLEDKKYPFVVKPTVSAGGNNVLIVHDYESLKKAVEFNLSTPSFYKVASEVLVQTALVGQEYIVNTVSSKGKHKAIEVWRVNRSKIGSPYLDCMELEKNGPLTKKIVQYIKNVLNTLGFKNGACHSELIVEGDIPSLVEINPRLHGDISLSAIKEATGTNHVIETCRSISNNYIFPDPDDNNINNSKYTCIKTQLHFNREGTIVRTPNWDEIKSLSSIREIISRVTIGKKTQSFRSVTNSAASVYLVNENQEVAWLDYKKLKSWFDIEINNCFDISK